MNYLINNAIDACCSEEFKKIFSDAVQIAANFELEGLEDALNSIVMSSDMYDPTDLQTVFHSKIYEYLRYLIDNHEIVLVEDTPITHVVVIANAIYNMQNWIDHDSIIRITETDASPEEKFASIVELVDTVSATSIFNSLESVPAKFIDVLQELHQKQSDIETLLNSDNPFNLYIEQLVSFKTFLKDIVKTDIRNILAFELIKQGMKPGGNFDFYYQQIKDKLEIKDSAYLATQYLALLYLGIDSHQSVLGFWRNHNEMLIDDLGLINQADIRLNELNSSFVSWRQNKSQLEKTT